MGVLVGKGEGVQVGVSVRVGVVVGEGTEKVAVRRACWNTAVRVWLAEVESGVGCAHEISRNTHNRAANKRWTLWDLVMAFILPISKDGIRVRE